MLSRKPWLIAYVAALGLLGAVCGQGFAQTTQENKGTAAPSNALYLIKDGTPVATIVTPDGADAVTQEAATMLADTLKQSTGAQLPIAKESAATNGTKIYVGPTAAAQKAGLSTADFVGDSYIWKVIDGNLYILGRDTANLAPRTLVGARGTLKAALNLVQKYAGVRWVMPTPDGIWTPYRSDVWVPADLNVTQIPYMLYTSQRYDKAYPWSLANGARRTLPLFDAGGHTWWCAFPNQDEIRRSVNSHVKAATQPDMDEEAVDTLRKKMTKEANLAWAAAHPDVFAMVNGRRLNKEKDLYNDKGQYNPSLCTSHPDFVPTMTKWVEGKFDEGNEIVQLAESDGLPGRHCQCDRCNELYGLIQIGGGEVVNIEPIGKRMFVPHLQIIDNCGKSRPKGLIRVLVYAGARPYLMGEKDYGVRLPPNAIAEATNGAVEQLDALRRTCTNTNLYGRYWNATLYNYWFSPYHGGASPKQTPVSINAQQRKAIRYGLLGNYYGGGGDQWPLEAPLYYICFRTIEDPQQDPWEMLHEFCQGLYGNAADTMEQYYKALYENVKADPSGMGSGTPPMNTYVPKSLSDSEKLALRHRAKYLACWPPEKLALLGTLLEHAEKQAAGDERALKYLQLARIGYEMINHTGTCFALWDKYEKTSDRSLAGETQQAIAHRTVWIERIRDLGKNDPTFVKNYFPGYKEFVLNLWKNDAVTPHEGSRLSPLGKPFTGVDFDAILANPD